MTKKRVLALLAALVLLLALCPSALAAVNRGNDYDHIDVKLPAKYTVTIDGVDVPLTGTVEANSVTVYIGNRSYNMGSNTRTEDGLYEYNLSRQNIDPDDIAWTDANSWTMENVSISATLVFNMADHTNLSTAQKLALSSIFTVDTANNAWVCTLTKAKYTGIQECTGGGGMRSDGGRGTPTGLDLYITAKQFGTMITTGVMSIQKTVVGENGADIDDSTAFKFTVEYLNASGAYVPVQFTKSGEGYAYVSAGEGEASVVTITGNDVVTMTGLPVGMYRVTEAINPDYVILGADGEPDGNYSKNYTVVEKTDDSIPILNFVNRKLTDKDHLFAIRKTFVCAPGAADHAHADPIVTIKSSDGSITVTGVVGGEYVYFDLPNGTYTLTESNVGANYVLTVNGEETVDNAYTFTIDNSDAKYLTLDLVNTYTEQVVEEDPVSVLTIRKTWGAEELSEELLDYLMNHLVFTVKGPGVDRTIPYIEFFYDGEYVLTSEDDEPIQPGATYTVTESFLKPEGEAEEALAEQLDGYLHVSYAHVNGVLVSNSETSDHVTSIKLATKDNPLDESKNLVAEAHFHNVYYGVGQLVVSKTFDENSDLNADNFPGGIDVQLWQVFDDDGEEGLELIEEVTLTRDHWRHDFVNLYPGKYRIVEILDTANREGYLLTSTFENNRDTVTVSVGETSFITINNKYTDEKVVDELPQTGDGSSLALWMLAMMLASAGIAFLAQRRRA